jgi:hypothetical protein
LSGKTSQNGTPSFVIREIYSISKEKCSVLRNFSQKNRALKFCFWEMNWFKLCKHWNSDPVQAILVDSKGLQSSLRGFGGLSEVLGLPRDTKVHERTPFNYARLQDTGIYRFPFGMSSFYYVLILKLIKRHSDILGCTSISTLISYTQPQ